MCRSDDENNEMYPENYKSDVKNSIPVAVSIDGTWQNDMASDHCWELPLSFRLILEKF